MRRKGSLSSRMFWNIWIAVMPLAVLLAYGIYDMHSYYTRYDHIVTNITSANAYNIEFKNRVDEAMYQIVIGSANWTNSREKLKNVDPYEDINQAREQFHKLYDSADNTENKRRLRTIIRLINTLEDRVDDIISNVEEGGHYDENMTAFNMNITILTELTQEAIQEYIYYEAQEMEAVRAEVSANAFRDLRTMLILLLVILAFNAVISRYMVRKVTEPIFSLCDANKKFAQGDFAVRVPVNNKNELDNLADSFNKMAEKITVLVQDIKNEQRKKRKLELSLLQSQINPHFLYNTLDTILWLTDSDKKEEAVHMLTSLSSFFRVALSGGRENITVGEEIRHVRSYLEIQRLRYRDIMEYEIDVPDEIKQYYIVKLTLQPLVENALYHGIKNKRGMGLISIKGEIHGTNLLFTVKDNGIGMEQSMLDKLRKCIESDIRDDENCASKALNDTGRVQDVNHGFGLMNVQQRLKLGYGDEYGISIYSTYGDGTTVEVLIPRLVEGDLAENYDEKH